MPGTFVVEDAAGGLHSVEMVDIEGDRQMSRLQTSPGIGDR